MGGPDHDVTLVFRTALADVVRAARPAAKAAAARMFLRAQILALAGMGLDGAWRLAMSARRILLQSLEWKPARIPLARQRLLLALEGATMPGMILPGRQFFFGKPEAEAALKARAPAFLPEERVLPSLPEPERRSQAFRNPAARRAASVWWEEMKPRVAAFPRNAFGRAVGAFNRVLPPGFQEEEAERFVRWMFTSARWQENAYFLRRLDEAFLEFCRR